MTYKRGSRGAVVKQIQTALHLLADGIFGTMTEDAVKDFQSRNGLKVDGIVGPKTLAMLLPERVKKSRRTINEIIIHCSATPKGRDFGVEDIRRWHKQQGWSDVGYHYVIKLDGTIEDGRDVDVVGAHCSGHNLRSIGICYIGGMSQDGSEEEDTRTDAQKKALLTLLFALRDVYPKAAIHGHRDFAHKACPSFDATKEYKNI